MADLAQLLRAARTKAMAVEFVRESLPQPRLYRLEGGGKVEFSVQCGHSHNKLMLYFDSVEECNSCLQQLRAKQALRNQIKSNMLAGVPLDSGIDAFLHGDEDQQQQQQQKQQPPPELQHTGQQHSTSGSGAGTMPQAGNAAAATVIKEGGVQGMVEGAVSLKPGGESRRSVFERLAGGIWKRPTAAAPVAVATGAAVAAGAGLQQAPGDNVAAGDTNTPTRGPDASPPHPTGESQHTPSQQQQQQRQQWWKQPLKLEGDAEDMSIKHAPKGYDLDLFEDTRLFLGRGQSGQVWLTGCKWRRVPLGPRPLLHPPQQQQQQQGEEGGEGSQQQDPQAGVGAGSECTTTQEGQQQQQQQQAEEQEEEAQLGRYSGLLDETHIVIKDVYCGRVQSQTTLQKVTTQGLYQVLVKRLPGVVDVLCAWVHMEGNAIVGFSYGMRWLGPSCRSLAQLIQGPGISGRPAEEEDEDEDKGSRVFSNVVACRKHLRPTRVQWRLQGFSWGAVLLLLAKQVEVALAMEAARAVTSDWKGANVLVPDPQPLQQLNAFLLARSGAAPAAAAAAAEAVAPGGAAAGSMSPAASAAAAEGAQVAAAYEAAFNNFEMKVCDKEAIVLLPDAEATAATASSSTSTPAIKPTVQTPSAAIKPAIQTPGAASKRLDMGPGNGNFGSVWYMAPEVEKAGTWGKKADKAATFAAQLFSIAVTTLMAVLRCPEIDKVAILSSMQLGPGGAPAPFLQLAAALGMPALLRALLAWLLQRDPTKRPTPEELRALPLLLPNALSAEVWEQLLATMPPEEACTWEEWVAALCTCRTQQLAAELVLGEPTAGMDVQAAHADLQSADPSARKRAAAEAVLGGVAAAAPHVGGATADGATSKKQRV